VNAFEVRSSERHLQIALAASLHRQEHTAARRAPTSSRKSVAVAAHAEVEVALRGVTDVDRAVADRAPRATLVKDVGEHQQLADGRGVGQVDLQQLFAATFLLAGAVVVAEADERTVTEVAEVGVRLECLHGALGAVAQLVHTSHVNINRRRPREVHVNRALSLTERDLLVRPNSRYAHKQPFFSEV